MKNQLKYGRSKEKTIATKLKQKGCSTTLSPASRSPSDIKVRGRKRWNIQVKATRKNQPPHLSPEERRRLKIQARKENAVPVIAQVKRGKVTFRSVRTGKKLYV
jgi:Holliday junction resolvase